MRRSASFLLSVAGCGGLSVSPALQDPPADCAAEVEVFTDADGDGVGGASAGRACAAATGQTLTGGDCDDANAAVSPEAVEVCDDLDNDCDLAVDDGLPRATYYPDADGDGFGAVGSAGREDCGGAGWAREPTDCDDAVAAVNPAAEEICNDHVDDDCDGFADDDDPDIDPAVLTSWYRDLDGDGYGDDAVHQEICEQPAPNTTDAGGDCDDLDPARSPGEPEVCNYVDDDCDGLVDDDDPGVDPAELTDTWTDADGDGYGDPLTLTPACRLEPGRVANDLDCDDSDAGLGPPVDWLADADGDGVGAGASLGSGCVAPAAGAVPASYGSDCDDGNADRFPGNPEVCGDGVDQDCSGSDGGCATWLYTVRTTDGMLRRLDVDTLAWDDVGPLGVYFDFGDLAYDRDDHVLYMIDGRGARGLWTVDLVTGAASPVGVHGIPDLFGLAWDASTDTLYATQSTSFTGLWRLDQVTGAATFIGNPGVNLDGLTYDFARNQLVGVNAGPGDLYRIDRATGARTFLGSGGFVNNGGLAYDEPGDLLWTIDWSGSVYRFDPAAGYARSTVLLYQGSHDGFVYVPDPPN